MSMSELARRIDRMQACLLGVRIGDGMGQAFETMSRLEILGARTRGKHAGKSVRGFLPSVQTRIEETGGLEAGAATDDWELTKAVAESLIEYERFNLESMVAFHVEALRRSKVGWGVTTTRGIQEVALWYESEKTKGRSPHIWPTAPVGRSGGNGIAIKITPIALSHANKYGEDGRAADMFTTILELGRLTHSDPDAIFCAWILAAAIRKVFFNPVLNTDGAINLLHELVHELAHEVWGENGIPGMVYPEEIERRLYALCEMIPNTERIRTEITPNFRALDSVMYSLGIFCSHPRDFREAVLAAVNAGWDTDSTASMVGALEGANNGTRRIPKKWKYFRKDFEEAFTLGTKLYTVTAGR